MKKKSVAKHAGGRPPVLTGRVREHAISSIRKYGLTATKQRLAERKVPVIVCLATLSNLAAREEIPMRVGRPPLRKAA